jgi:hypothetical protein
VLKNLTITAEAEVLQWAKHEAIEKGLSVSKFIGAILAEEMRRTDSYEKARRSWKRIEPWPIRASERLSREDANERHR